MSLDASTRNSSREMVSWHVFHRSWDFKKANGRRSRRSEESGDLSLGLVV